MKWSLVAITLSAALFFSCNGSDPVPVPEPGTVIVSSRLSNLRVNSIAEDSDGHIWIATSRGLNKYNAHEFHQYFCADDTLGLPDNQINIVYSTRAGTLWAGTVMGAAFRQPDGRFHRVDVPDFNRNVSSIMETPSGEVLLSNGNSVYLYDASGDRLSTVIRDINAFGLPYMTVCSDGRLWAVLDGGYRIAAYSTSDWKQVFSAPTPHPVYHLSPFGGELWLSGMGGISRLDLTTCEFLPLPDAIKRNSSLMHADVDLLCAVDDNTLLLNTIADGIYAWVRSTGRLLHQDDPDFPFDAPSFNVSTIFRDSRHNLWFGSTDQGYHVSYQYKDPFNADKALTGAFANKSVVALCPDRAGHLWVSTFSDGLYWYDGSAHKIDLEAFVPDNKLGYVRCSSIFCDSDGELWLALTDKFRVLRCSFNGGRLKLLDVISTMNPMAIAEDDRGQIWIGGFGRHLIRYDKKSRRQEYVEILPEGEWTFVSVLYHEEPGRMLLGAFNHPVMLLNPYTGTAVTLPFPEEERKALIRRNVLITTSILRDSAGDVWVGTTANGLICHHSGNDSFSQVKGVPCQDISSLEEDQQGNLWVSTMNGLGKYDRTTGSFTNFFKDDGIGGDQFYERASCMLPGGLLAFGGTHGITLFNPLDIIPRRVSPVVFQDLKVHNRLVQPGDGAPMDTELRTCPDITIRPSENAFSISFAALDYSEFSRIRYAYKMEGFDIDWVDAGSAHEAYYANLPAGRYTFRVRAAGPGGPESSLRVRILPPWWKTWWAIVLYVLAGLSLLAFIYYYSRRVARLRRKAAARIAAVRQEKRRAEEEKAMQERLNRIQMNYFSNVAHEFRTPLTMIAGPASQLAASEGISGQDRQLVSVIHRSSIWMLSLVNQLLDFNRIGNSKLQLKVCHSDVIGPLRNIIELFRFNAGSKGIELIPYGLEDQYVMWADIDKLQKICMNLLSNALKFTPSGGRVTLQFDVVKRSDAAVEFPLTDADASLEWAQFTVTDTGCGIAPEDLERIFERFFQGGGQSDTQGSGIGLYYARVLCGLHHGYIRAWNREQGGARFSFILPVDEFSYTSDEKAPKEASQQLQSVPEPLAWEADVPEEAKCVAVVDDDIDVANYVKMLLVPQYRVQVYFSAEAAIKGMREDAPDLVVSDVVMPGMSGYELCEAVKGDLQLSHIPVILVTAKVAVESQIQGLDKGADAYVTKPFQPAYLLALVRSQLENRDKLKQRLGVVTEASEVPDLSPRDRSFMQELYALMDKELANAELDVTRITEMMKISRTKFYYKVKGLTGENPSVFFKRYKLNRAADLLKEGKHNMSEIAWMTGFSTLSHFSTSFKKQFGVPPSDYVG